MHIKKKQIPRNFDLVIFLYPVRKIWNFVSVYRLEIVHRA